MRNILSPSFRSSKMRFMFGLAFECSHDFFDYLHHHPELCSMVDGDATFKRSTNDAIGMSTFGISVNTLKDRKNEFYETGIDISTMFAPIVRDAEYVPPFSQNIRIKAKDEIDEELPSQNCRQRCEDSKGARYRQAIHLLIQARDEQNMATITVDDIVAQVFIFFLAGFDAVSTMMSFMTLELALSHDVQEKLREETDHFLIKEGLNVHEYFREPLYLFDKLYRVAE
ncbi:putative cytochrome P450 9h1 [Megalopta genalis]|uniref:putative cytochrome P450 9h1 n=1 Tax=Megalopta genalis TaxID=115081 RepID=UPI003FD037E6